MCGRFTLSATPEAIAEEFNIKNIPDSKPTYNVAPTQNVLAVLNEEKTLQHQFKKLRWGLIPSWAKDFSIGARLINARSETVAEKPAFRSPYKRRRCLVVADGFFEWKKQKDKKQPFYFLLQNQRPFAFAGLWEKWTSPQGEQVHSCTILTTTANKLLQPIHHRMPLLLKQQDYELWLDPQVQSPALLQDLLFPYPSEDMKSYEVSSFVNNPKHNSHQCVEAIA